MQIKNDPFTLISCYPDSVSDSRRRHYKLIYTGHQIQRLSTGGRQTRRRTHVVPGQVWADEWAGREAVRRSGRRPGGFVWISPRVIILITGGHTHSLVPTPIVSCRPNYLWGFQRQKFDSSQTIQCVWSRFQSAFMIFTIVAQLAELHLVSRHAGAFMCTKKFSSVNRYVQCRLRWVVVDYAFNSANGYLR